MERKRKEQIMEKKKKEVKSIRELKFWINSLRRNQEVDIKVNYKGGGPSFLQHQGEWSIGGGSVLAKGIVLDPHSKDGIRIKLARYINVPTGSFEIPKIGSIRILTYHNPLTLSYAENGRTRPYYGDDYFSLSFPEDLLFL